MYTYGIIGGNGPIEGVTLQSGATMHDRAIAQKVVDNHGGEIDEHLPGVHRGEMKKRLAQQGATEVRFFPKEDE